MGLPIYQTINVRSYNLEDLQNWLHPELNLIRPVVINLKVLTFEQQREFIGLIENYFHTGNYSFKFPYPLYLITDHDQRISEIPILLGPEELPKFFQQKEAKMNVEESHLVERNKLIQKEIKNMDSEESKKQLKSFSETHKIIFLLEKECHFYESILNKSQQKSKNSL